MTGRLHRLVRAVALVAALAVPLLRLRTPPPPPLTGVRAALLLPNAPDEPGSPARALFAGGAIAMEDATPIEAPALVGIAGRLPDQVVALLRLADGSTRAVAPGARADGWRVAAIEGDRVRLARGGEVREEVLPPRD